MPMGSCRMNSGTADWISGPNTLSRRSGRSAKVATTSRSAMPVIASPSFLRVAGNDRVDPVDIDLRLLDTRALDLEQHADPTVARAPAAGHRLGQLFQGHVGEAHRHADFLAETDRERHVLMQQPKREIGRVVLAGEELAHAVEGARPAGRPLTHRLP